MKIVKTAAAAALLACSITLAYAQTKTTPSDSPSKAEPGAPEQGPGKQVPTGKQGPTGTGGAAIGPPATQPTPAPTTNPTGMSKEKQKSDQEDPLQGGKKQ
jgi:hypothetical protein